MLDGFKDLQQPDEPDLVTELIDLFLEDTGKHITALKQAVANRETAEIKEQAHAIKGSSGNNDLYCPSVVADLESGGNILAES